MADPFVSQDAKFSSAAWHCLDIQPLAARLGTTPEGGLDKAEAAARLEKHGPNAIREGERRSPWRMFFEQFTDFMIVVLIVAAVISGALGEVIDTIAILVIVVLNAVIGFIQEYRAEQAMAALKKLAAAFARVVRSGEILDVPAAQLVPGDVVLLEAGNVVPADLRLVEVALLRVEEAALTGESVPAEKVSGALDGADVPLGDRRNMAYKGTIVAYGRGRGVVVGTGMQTELGKIAALLSAEEGVQTPLQKRMADFGRKLAYAALGICVLVFIFGLMRGEPLMLMFMTAVSLAVAAIPEALPAVITISLALGARKMVARNALIRRLPAVEALGSVTFICSDKTGTLTLNRMHVEEAYVDGERRAIGALAAGAEPSKLLMQAVALNNDATVTADGRELGDPTEIALLRAAHEAGFERRSLEAGMPRAAELPFDSDRKAMTTLHTRPDGVLAFTKGAPEKILERCVSWHRDSGVAALDLATALETAERMASDGLRVIAYAYRRWERMPEKIDPASTESELVFLGLVGMIDPPRPEVEDAVKICRDAGITPVMVTGDHPATARAIARRLGILDEGGRVLTGQELAKMSIADFERDVKTVRVYARVDPSQKIMLVTALQKAGEFVAMTGDGVNDAPAIKRAEVGIAMGKIGTDVAREASSMVLLDDNFATIVGAVREGRRIYDNIRKFIRYVLAGNVGEIVAIAVAPFLGMPIPLLPIQILWVNLVTDGLPGLALALEPEERRIMQRPPRPPDEGIFARGMWQQVLWTGILIGGISIFTQWWGLQMGSPGWQTMAFTSLTMCQMFVAFSIRSDRESLFTIGVFSNPHLVGAVGITFVLQLAVIYVPALNPIFKTVPLSAQELAICIALPALVLVAVELEKYFIRSGLAYRERPAT